MNSPFNGKYGPLLIAEIGGNHEGDFEYARELTRLAASTEADYVKYQLYTGDTLVSRLESPQRNEHFKKFELTREQHIELAEMVIKAGKGYLASVWDMSIMEWIDPYLSIYKTGSGDLTAYPMLEAIAEKGKPVILSTGLATEKEVLEAVAYLQQQNWAYKDPNMLALLQCTSMYPIAAGDANLSAMERLRELTGLTVGYSDHTEGMKALYYAAAMGAEILEFHFTDSREGKIFRDHKVSLTPAEVNKLAEELSLIRTLKGDGIKRPLPVELDNGHEISFRRAVYPVRDMAAGTVITAADLVCLRPAHGIDARDFEKVPGKRLKTAVKAHQKLEWSNLE